MIYKVDISEQADNDLRGIYEYIAFELQSPENAGGQLDRLEEHILKAVLIMTAFFILNIIRNLRNYMISPCLTLFHHHHCLAAQKAL